MNDITTGHSSIEHTCGMIIFPVTFVLGDVINEYFGPKVVTNDTPLLSSLD